MTRWSIAGLLFAATQAVQAGPTQDSVLVLDFELVAEMHDPRNAQADAARLARSGPQLREALSACSAFRIVGPEKAAEAIARAASRNAYLYRCNGCAQDLARAAGTDLVAFAWVQKVSNLILNVNAELQDGRTGQPVATQSVDMRGNTDRSWEKAVDALSKRLCESRMRRIQRRDAPSK